MRTGSTRVDVMASGGGGWDVKEPGSEHALHHADTREHALRQARTLLLARGGQIRLVGEDGHLTAQEGVDRAPRSWWYVPPGRSRWIAAGTFVVLGLLNLILRPTDWFGWIELPFGLAYAATAALSRRRDNKLVRRTSLPPPHG